MAMHSERAKPSSPMKAGILPSPLALRCSMDGLAKSGSTIFRSRPLAFATTLMAVLRGLSCERGGNVSARTRRGGLDECGGSAYRGGEENAERHLDRQGFLGGMGEKRMLGQRRFGSLGLCWQWSFGRERRRGRRGVDRGGGGQRKFLFRAGGPPIAPRLNLSKLHANLPKKGSVPTVREATRKPCYPITDVVRCSGGSGAATSEVHTM